MAFPALGLAKIILAVDIILEMDIPELALQAGALTCPKHQWAFDVASGACIKNGNTPLTRLDSKAANGRVLAFW